MDGPGERVSASVRFLKIGDINTKNQQFTAIVDLTFRWGVELLAERVASYLYLDTFLQAHRNESTVGFMLSEEEIKQCEDFIPQIVITNLEDTKKERTVYSFSIQGSEIQFIMRWHLKGNFYEQMELYDFPFDVQDLCVRLDLAERSKDKGFFLAADTDIPGILNDKSFQDEQEWDIFKMVQTGENNAQTPDDSDEEPDDVLVLRCNVKRKFNYFLYNCFLVMLFFAVMSMCNFANRPENVQFRLAGTLTLVLTSVAYKLMLSNSLPTISYLTLVDVYVLFSVFMLTFLVVAFAVLHTVYRSIENSMETAQRETMAFHLDVMTMAVLATIHVIWNISFGLYAFHKTRQVTDKLIEDENLYAEKLARVNGGQHRKGVAAAHRKKMQQSLECADVKVEPPPPPGSVRGPSCCEGKRPHTHGEDDRAQKSPNMVGAPNGKSSYQPLHCAAAAADQGRSSSRSSFRGSQPVAGGRPDGGGCSQRVQIKSQDSRSSVAGGGGSVSAGIPSNHHNSRKTTFVAV